MGVIRTGLPPAGDRILQRVRAGRAQGSELREHRLLVDPVLPGVLAGMESERLGHLEDDGCADSVRDERAVQDRCEAADL